MLLLFDTIWYGFLHVLCKGALIRIFFLLEEIPITDHRVYLKPSFYIGMLWSDFFPYVNTFIQQRCIKLIKIDSKNNVTKDFSTFSFLFIYYLFIYLLLELSIHQIILKKCVMVYKKY